MKLISLLLAVISTQSMAEVFYYGDHFLTVDLRSNQPSVLKFEKVPLSSACQPGVLKFEPLDPKTLSLGEAQRVQVETVNEQEKDTTISHLLRVTPQGSSGTITCSFTLIGGSQVPIRFNLTPNIARPFLEFRPIAEKFTSPQAASDLNLIQSLVNGDSFYLHDVTKNFEICSFQEPHMECRRLSHSTDLSNYELTYVGTDTSTAAWTLTLTLKKDADFVEIADLKATNGSKILYSVVTPQKPKYAKGEKLKHHILTGAQFNKIELVEVLP